MKLKALVIGGSGLFLMVFSLLLFVAILFSDEQDGGFSNIHRSEEHTSELQSR